MTDDREQDRTDERDNAARPVTAAARRARRASARDAAGPTTAKPTKATAAKPAKSSGAARVRRDSGAAEDTTDTTDATESATWDVSDRETTKGRSTPARDRRQKRPSLVKRSVRFFREVVSELRKVIWPTRKQQITYTVVVLVFVAVIVAVVFGLDTLFAKGVFWVFG